MANKIVMLPLKRNVKSGKPLNHFENFSPNARPLSSPRFLFLAQAAERCRPALIQPQLDHFSDYHQKIRNQGGPIFPFPPPFLDAAAADVRLAAAQKKISTKNSITSDARSKIIPNYSKMKSRLFKIFHQRLFRKE